MFSIYEMKDVGMPKDPKAFERQLERNRRNIWDIYRNCIAAEWQASVVKSKTVRMSLEDMLVCSYFPKGTTYNDLIDIMKLDRKKIDESLNFTYGLTLQECIEHEQKYYTD